MTTPEEHWAGLTGDELVAELRQEAEALRCRRSWDHHAYLRAAEVIKTQAARITELERGVAVTDTGPRSSPRSSRSGEGVR